jgi:hypothetical protein
MVGHEFIPKCSQCGCFLLIKLCDRHKNSPFWVDIPFYIKNRTMDQIELIVVLSVLFTSDWLTFGLH